jgi:hypothetical protein
VLMDLHLPGDGGEVATTTRHVALGK